MSSVTAQILIGNPHPDHIGITHYLFLSENSRPAWILVPENIFGRHRVAKITWIPTVKYMLEDAFLMIALHVLKNTELIELATSYYPDILSYRVELYDDLNDAQRARLYEKCRKLNNLPKMIISVFEGSHI